MKAILGISVIFLCGGISAFPAAEQQRRVVGGREAFEHEAPYIISLQVDFQSNGQFRHVCGGSILTPTWILSAAHCVTEVGMDLNYQIIAAQHNLAVESGNEQVRAVVETLIHENFVSGPVVGPFDIMVLRLASALTFVEGVVEPITLPPAGQITLGASTLFGWGSVSDTTTPRFPDILQTVTKPIIAWELCREIVNAVFDHEPLHSSNLCTGLEQNFSACNGDSGGPLVQNNGGELEVIGVVSWGSSFPCGSPNSVSVYVRTSAFIDWINARIQ